VTRIAAFAEIVIGKIRVGSIEAQEIVTNVITATSSSIATMSATTVDSDEVFADYIEVIQTVTDDLTVNNDAIIGNDLFVNGALIVSDSGITSSGGLTFIGDGRPTETITLSPE